MALVCISSESFIVRPVVGNVSLAQPRRRQTQCRARPDVITETRADRPSRHPRYSGRARNYPRAASNSSLMVALPVRDPRPFLQLLLTFDLLSFCFGSKPLSEVVFATRAPKPLELFVSCLAVATRSVSAAARCEFGDDRADFDRSGEET